MVLPVTKFVNQFVALAGSKVKFLNDPVRRAELRGRVIAPTHQIVDLLLGQSHLREVRQRQCTLLPDLRCCETRRCCWCCGRGITGSVDVQQPSLVIDRVGIAADRCNRRARRVFAGGGKYRRPLFLRDHDPIRGHERAGWRSVHCRATRIQARQEIMRIPPRATDRAAIGGGRRRRGVGGAA